MGYVEELYGIGRGHYNVLAGTLEPERLDGTPRVFVIGGGGRGIPIYRRLQRLGIPFAAGVLPENDLDVPTARALAAVLLTDKANEPVSPGRVDAAVPILEQCETVFCTTEFGTVNRENRRLVDRAEELGTLRRADEEDVKMK